jgi:hypothetical protein
MSNVAFTALFCVNYAIRFYTDINYTYKECLETNYLSIAITSILHSLVIAFMISAWIGSNKIYMYAIVLYIFIKVCWFLFNGCFLSNLANKICKKEIIYSDDWWLMVYKVVTILYILRTVIFIISLTLNCFRHT